MPRESTWTAGASYRCFGTPRKVSARRAHFDFERQWAVRQGDWKLLCNAIDVRPDDRNETLEGLYLTNLGIDPTESENLLGEYPEKAQELLKLREAYVASLEENDRR